jgi:hypothetical protein
MTLWIASATLIAMMSATTNITTPLFSAQLPGQWDQRPSDNATIYARGDDVIFMTTAMPGHEASERMAMRIADMRRKLIDDLARGTSKVTPIVKTADTGKTTFSFGGEDPQNGKRFQIAVIAFQDVIVTVALYRPLAAPAAGFDDLARSIASSVTGRH